jgi:predicted transcriptional regulator
MADHRVNTRRRRAGRPPAGAKEGERVKDYPQLSIRVPMEMKARLNALSAVTGLAQWRVIVEAIDCFVSDLPPTDRELVDGLSARLMRPAIWQEVSKRQPRTDTKRHLGAPSSAHWSR